MSQLALLSENNLTDILNFIISHQKEDVYKKRFLNETFVREYVQYDENDTHLTYHFHFKESNTVMNVMFNKDDYYGWILMKKRKQKIDKICSKLGIS